MAYVKNDSSNGLLEQPDYKNGAFEIEHDQFDVDPDAPQEVKKPVKAKALPQKKKKAEVEDWRHLDDDDNAKAKKDKKKALKAALAAKPPADDDGDDDKKEEAKAEKKAAKEDAKEEKEPAAEKKAEAA